MVVLEFLFSGDKRNKASQTKISIFFRKIVINSFETQQQIEQMRTKNKPIKKNVLHLKYICRIKFSLPYRVTVVLLSLEYIRHCSWWKWFIVVRFNVWVAKNRQLIELHGVSMKEFHWRNVDHLSLTVNNDKHSHTQRHRMRVYAQA